MTKQIIVLLILIAATLANGQQGYKMKSNGKQIDVNFLTSYYTQDGNNSAVEGGEGTELLTDFANIIVINVPIDSSKSIGLSGGLDTYTSASTDRIDSKISSASRQDGRGYGTISYKQKRLNKGQTFGVKAGFSQEYDYTSISGGLSFIQEWNEGNSELGLSAQAFFDKWTLYFPKELRGEVSVDTDARNSLNFSAVYSQVVNRKMQFAFGGEVIYMTGLLSTPFHRVYFSDINTPDIERLPNSRLKVPLSFRLNYFVHENVILRTYYRYYFDDFGISANTANLEISVKVNDNFRVAPFFRYHQQSGSKYFAAFEQHSSQEQFYTSDYDLSTLSSNKIGIRIGYYPAFGIAGTRLLKRDLSFKSIELRLAHYNRDTGLKAYMGSLNFAFRI
jgi:hypothetical protein